VYLQDEYYPTSPTYEEYSPTSPHYENEDVEDGDLKCNSTTTREFTSTKIDEKYQDMFLHDDVFRTNMSSELSRLFVPPSPKVSDDVVNESNDIFDVNKSAYQFIQSIIAP
jgi:hypothetical protein